MSRKHLSREEERRRKRRHWHHHHMAWEKSGLSQAEYCRRNNLRIKSFTYWRRKFRQSETSAQLVPVPSNLLEKVFEPQRAQYSLRVDINSKFKVEVGDDFTAGTLARLLDILERC